MDDGTFVSTHGKGKGGRRETGEEPTTGHADFGFSFGGKKESLSKVLLSKDRQKRPVPFFYSTPNRSKPSVGSIEVHGPRLESRRKVRRGSGRSH